MCYVYPTSEYHYRAWQRKLRSTVSSEENCALIYACLCLLISKGDVEKFLKNQSTFLSYWSDKEEQFTTYYKEEYKDRAGEQTGRPHIASHIT